ncbi:MAG TPA: PIG-L deacetylase family protein [Jiangellaceae bacterium]
MPQTQLPPWDSVLAVVAHPDDESFALGAVLGAFAEAGAKVSVLCLTRGEASTLHGVAGDLTELRSGELAAAAAVLGLHDVTLLAYPDGALSEVDLDRLAAEVTGTVGDVGADGIIGFDLSGVTGHPDHAHATVAAVRAGNTLDLPVLGWTVPDTVAQQLRREHGARFVGHAETEVDIVVTVDRSLQHEAVRCHPSQAVPGSVMWRRIELLGDEEHLRWLRRTTAP